ncbi:MAG: phosphoribosylglycinamide formyltransferase [Alphaproteobacteria bacterium]|nr:phosphoribosylglycinamide formyltransferase [Alphaproteobacteria bacterium]
MSQQIKTAILFSGRGSNMLSLADHMARADVPAQLVLTICNRPQAAGITHAKNRGLPCEIIDHTEFASRADFEAAMQKELAKAEVELICAAGFMRLLTPAFVAHWQGRLLNIHPSLLPKHRGLNTHQAALDAGDKWHGCTVHYMQAEMDDIGENEAGLLVQRRVPILPDDRPDTLAARVVEQEHTAYPEALDIVLAKLRA